MSVFWAEVVGAILVGVLDLCSDSFSLSKEEAVIVLLVEDVVSCCPEGVGEVEDLFD